ncbi:MAG: hypothetical protein HY562_01780 [Ignavibacteriales bacterium]|nr:hypothetical protein [Ignavibacteriales bacterium]
MLRLPGLQAPCQAHFSQFNAILAKEAEAFKFKLFQVMVIARKINGFDDTLMDGKKLKTRIRFQHCCEISYGGNFESLRFGVFDDLMPDGFHRHNDFLVGGEDPLGFRETALVHVQAPKVVVAKPGENV